MSVLTNKAETTVSSLIIQKASVEDGGVYSCQAGQIDPTSVKIHVLTGTSITVVPKGKNHKKMPGLIWHIFRTAMTPRY